jgi:hypothetical protein
VTFRPEQPLAVPLPDEEEDDTAPSSAEHECMRCGGGNDAVLGEVVKDRFGFLHASCRYWTEIEISGCC